MVKFFEGLFDLIIHTISQLFLKEKKIVITYQVITLVFLSRNR